MISVEFVINSVIMLCLGMIIIIHFDYVPHDEEVLKCRSSDDQCKNIKDPPSIVPEMYAESR